MSYAPHGAATTYDVYLPNDGRTARPALLLIHGGSWVRGSKQGFGDYGKELARNGYVAISIDYRLVPDGNWPLDAQDARCALAHVRNHAADYGVDKDRVAVFGYSAGGHLASVLGVMPDDPELVGDCSEGPTPRPRAIISGDGPQDLLELAWTPQVQAYMGATEKEQPDAYRKASPLYNVTAAAPPFLFVHGEQDIIVPEHQSEKMQAALRSAGVRADLVDLYGGGHVINPQAGTGALGLGETVNTPAGWWAIQPFLEDVLGAP